MHARSRIYAEGGPIIIGKNNIIEEKVIILNRFSETLNIGDNNLFEVGSCIYIALNKDVECKKIGNDNVIEVEGIIVPLVKSSMRWNDGYRK